MANLWLEYAATFSIALSMGFCGCDSDGSHPYDATCLCDISSHETPPTAKLPQACFWTHRGDGYDGMGLWHVEQDDSAVIVAEREDASAKQKRKPSKGDNARRGSGMQKSKGAPSNDAPTPDLSPSKIRRDDRTNDSRGDAAACIDINTADVDALSRLPGIGKSRAEAIIAARTKRPFRKPASLMRVKGVGKKAFDKMAPHICPF